ncbi:hypothetical protein KUL42_10580 [Alteromonas sp. KUL42]|nr:hypothetical protein KUL42_10580 [Alteromonas sp. KUL42]
MESYALILAIVVITAIALDIKLSSSLKRNDYETFISLGKPSYWATPKKYMYWYSFILLSGYKKHNLSSQSTALCVANKIVILTVHAMILGWFLL